MRYVIVAPTYNQKTAGIKTLQELQKWLIRSGKDAIIPNIDINAPYSIEDDDIAIYPEIISGNPLNAKRVVRYILNVPGKLGGDRKYDNNEILVAYDPKIAEYSNGVVLATPTIEEFFTNRGYERTIDCVWVGKGQNTHHPATKDCIEITYTWPAKRRELAELLNRTRTLYSYDGFTMLLTEAKICGCELKLIADNEIIDFQLDPPNLDEFKKQLDQFIQMTWYPEMNSAREAAEYIETIISSRPPTLVPLSTIPDLTSIIILTWNQLEYTKTCLASIRAYTDVSYEIIFADNGSSDGTVEWLREQAAGDSRIAVIESRENHNVAVGCNKGMRAAVGSHMVLLKNNTVVTPGWLAGLREPLERYPDAGIIGPITNSASGAQVLTEPDYGSLDNLSGWAASFRDNNRYRLFFQRRVDGFCMLFSRELVEKIGLLDESFGLGNFVDDDYCLRAELAGYRNIIAGDVFVHRTGDTTCADNSINCDDDMMQSTVRYHNKWNYDELDQTTLRKLIPLDVIQEARRLALCNDTDNAIKLLIEKGIKTAPDNFVLYKELAEILIATGHHGDAMQVMKEMPSTADLEAMFEIEAVCQAALGDDDAAWQIASQAPERPRALVVMGTIAARRGNIAEAEALFRRSIRVDLSCASGWLSLGMILWGRGEQEDAWQAVKRSVVIDQRNEEAVAILRDMAQRIEHSSEVEKLIGANVQKDPFNHSIARYHAGMLAQYVQPD